MTCTVKKKLESMAEGVDVESEVGGVERDHGQADDSDDVIGPPLPPGYKVRMNSIKARRLIYIFLGV